MGLPWFRIVMIIVMLSSDDVEGALASIAHVVLSWSLRELLSVTQQCVMIPKLVKLGQVHPEAWRRAKIPWLGFAFHFAIAGAMQWGLYRGGSARLGLFLILTAYALPVFKSVMYPRLWTMVPFLGFVMYFVWTRDGVRELLVGLALFQGVSTLQETRGYYFGTSAAWSFAIWIVAFACTAPILVIFAVAYFNSPYFERMIKYRKRAKYARMWWWFERYAYVLGYESEEGDDPFTILGVRRTASTVEIRKRFRDLSLMYHPDKTGNDSVKREMFIKVQKAMEMITKGTFDDARPDAETMVQSRALATIKRCGSLWSLIVIWLALSVLQGIVFLGQRAHERRERELNPDASSSEANKYPEVHIGPTFVGSSILGFTKSRQNQRRGVENVNAGGARVVGNRRIATPHGQAPRFDEVEPTEPADPDAEGLRRRRTPTLDPVENVELD